MCNAAELEYVLPNERVNEEVDEETNDAQPRAHIVGKSILMRCAIFMC